MNRKEALDQLDKAKKAYEAKIKGLKFEDVIVDEVKVEDPSTVKDKDGNSYLIHGDLEEGVVITNEDETALAAGEIVLEDGKVLTIEVVDAVSIVKSIKEAEEVIDEEVVVEDPTAMKEFSKRLSAMEAMMKKFANGFKAQSEMTKATYAAVAVLNEEVVEDGLDLSGAYKAFSRVKGASLQLDKIQEEISKSFSNRSDVTALDHLSPRKKVSERADAEIKKIIKK